jgi:tRNA(adenine34) deaminase
MNFFSETESSPDNNDELWMAKALLLARKAEQSGEVPVGAVIVKDDELIGEGWNQPIQNHDPSAHAEIQAIRSACQFEKNYRLIGATLYVTLEPCAMCAGAIVHARIPRVVFAAHDPRTGAAESVFSLLDNAALNHRCEFVGGIYAEESSTLLKDFFRVRR